MFQGQVTVFVAEEVGVAFLVHVGMREVFETEPFLQQFFFLHFLHFLRAQRRFQDAAVLLQSVVDVADIRTAGRFQVVVVRVAAVIVAKLLVCTSVQGFAAGKTVPVGSRFDNLLG